MSTTDRLTRMRNIRNNLEKEVENETAARLAMTEAGNPPPTSYSVAGKSVSWNEWLSTTLAQIKDLNDLILNMGGDEGGIPEVSVQLWS